jgi:hypothetical protein
MVAEEKRAGSSRKLLSLGGLAALLVGCWTAGSNDDGEDIRYQALCQCVTCLEDREGDFCPRELVNDFDLVECAPALHTIDLEVLEAEFRFQCAALEDPEEDRACALVELDDAYDRTDNQFIAISNLETPCP